MTTSQGSIAYTSFHPDHQELIKYFKENKIFTIQIESNLACRQGCLYCYVSSSNALDRELPEDVVKSVLDTAAVMGVKSVDWLGGDPLERNGWYELMKYGMKLGLRNNIWTSGLPLASSDIAEKAVEVSEKGFISVHLDTLDEVLYKKLHVGNPGENIASIIKGIDNLLALGKKPDNIFNCVTFTKLLAGKDIEHTIKYFFEKEGVRTCLTQICKVGSALEHPEWIPTLDEIRNAVSIRDSVNYTDTSITMSTMDANKFYCGGTICVTIDGDVTPCSVIRKGFGNVLYMPLETIVEKNRDILLYTKLRDNSNLPGNCKTCTNNSICWGCRATAYYEEGDILAKDPKCMLGKF